MGKLRHGKMRWHSPPFIIYLKELWLHSSAAGHLVRNRNNWRHHLKWWQWLKLSTWLSLTLWNTFVWHFPWRFHHLIHAQVLCCILCCNCLDSSHKTDNQPQTVTAFSSRMDSYQFFRVSHFRRTSWTAVATSRSFPNCYNTKCGAISNPYQEV